MYCHKCGKELDEDAVYCSYCGASVDGSTDATDRTTHYIPYPGKSVGTALVLGFFFSGLGHLYIGKLARGLCIMMIEIALTVATVMTSSSVLNNDYLTYDEFVGVMIFTLLLTIPAFILLVWNLFDVNKLAKEYNDCIRRTGTPPW